MKRQLQTRSRMKPAGGSGPGISLGERVQSARRSLGLSLREFAIRVGSSPSHLSKIENNRGVPSLRTLANISDVLCRKLEWLVEPLNNQDQVTLRQRSKRK